MTILNRRVGMKNPVKCLIKILDSTSDFVHCQGTITFVCVCGFFLVSETLQHTCIHGYIHFSMIVLLRFGDVIGVQ